MERRRVTATEFIDLAWRAHPKMISSLEVDGLLEVEKVDIAAITKHVHDVIFNDECRFVNGNLGPGILFSSCQFNEPISFLNLIAAKQTSIMHAYSLNFSNCTLMKNLTLQSCELVHGLALNGTEVKQSIDVISFKSPAGGVRCIRSVLNYLNIIEAVLQGDVLFSRSKVLGRCELRVLSTPGRIDIRNSQFEGTF